MFTALNTARKSLTSAIIGSAKHNRTINPLDKSRYMATTTIPDDIRGSPHPLKLSGALASYESFDLTPTTGTEFAPAAQISELLHAPNADDLIRDVAILVAQRNVVFFRSQDNLSIADQRLLAVKLGELSGKPASSKLHQHPLTDEASELGDEVTIISSQMSGFAEDIYYAGDKSKFASKDWHADVTFEPVPADYTILKIHTLPPTGGDTLWASGYEAYDRLSPSFAAYLETLSAVHEARIWNDIAKAMGTVIREGPRGSPLNIGKALEATHPIIRTNPVTGWKSLFVNPSFTKRIVGVTKDESDAILKYLFSLCLENHDLQVRFKWKKNSLAIWDNRSTYHTATYDYGKTLRVGDRVVSVGEQPFYDAKSLSRRAGLGLK